MDKKSMVKACIISFTGLNTDGTDSTRILKEMVSLAKSGYDVNAIGLKITPDLFEDETYEKVTIKRVEPSFGFDRNIQQKHGRGDILSSLKRLYTLVFQNTIATTITLIRASRKEEADVYHCFGIYSLIPGFILKIFIRKRVIYDGVEAPHQQIRNIPSLGIFAKPLARLVGALELGMASRMDYILTLPSVNNEYLNRKIMQDTFV